MDSTILLTMINPITALTFFLVFFLIWKQQPHQRYILNWAWGYAAASLGFGSEFLNIMVPSIPLWIGFNLLLPLSGWFFVRGMCLRYDEVVPERLLLSMLAVTGAAVLWFGFVMQSAMGRGSAASVGLAAILIVGLQAIRKQKKKENVDLGIIIATFSVTFLMIARPVVSFFLEGSPHIGSINVNSFWVVSIKFLGLFGWLLFAILFLLRIAADLLADLNLQSITDPLSGILNRRGFMAVALSMSNDATKTLPVSLLILDIDHFKRINDTYGHQTGDEAIKLIANVMQTSVPENAAVGRLGGEEFAILLPNTSALAGQGVAEALCAFLRIQTHVGIPVSSPVTVSIGLVEGTGESLDQLIQRADAALYQAKHGGRDQVRLADPAEQDTVEQQNQFNDKALHG
ncbi:diguanylate cyclase (GGDEF) domain-containing protein [Hoeflea sp. IMCC20628]|uniref:GGDEF domain-containing protein n=1 Tax=Hoeflea sp. IMCC20628 TaxID=1620421 RepID=UPI00063BD639|nr:GGDEF domain-containing protein [Hoeflea sp. IMCC20628]AKH99212.1 diguanylate cyclase (GGDEF) domain-containing protein [Hoeflea sp. IMCC20628]